MENLLKSLPDGFRVADFRLKKVIGQGGFGITYLALDESLEQEVAIKEYYPREFANRDSTFTIHAVGNVQDKETFQWGLSRFLDEARILAKLNHPNVVAVKRFFEANGTAYLVMEYCVGKPLDEIIRDHGPLSQNEINPILYSLLDGLEHVHENEFLHRDIKPANIFIRENGSPVLLDFGAAKHEMTSHSKSVTSLATAGYAPFEQYSTRGKQGPWSDVYGLAATIYRAITGIKPQDAPDRILEDQVIPASELMKGKFDQNLLLAIDQAMAVRPENRPQSVREFRELIKSGNKRSNATENSKVDIHNGKSKTSSSGSTLKIFGVLAAMLIVVAIAYLTQSSTTSKSTHSESKDVTDRTNTDAGRPVVSVDTNNKSKVPESPEIVASPPAAAPVLPPPVAKSPIEVALGEYQLAYKSGRTSQAEEILRKALQTSPNSPKLHFELSQLLVMQKRYAEAHASINRAKALDPSLSFVASKDRFMSIYDEIISFENKLQIEREKNSELNSSINAILDEGESCFSQKKFDCAIASANNVLRLRSDNDRALSLKSRAQAAQKTALESITVN